MRDRGEGEDGTEEAGGAGADEDAGIVLLAERFEAAGFGDGVASDGVVERRAEIAGLDGAGRDADAQGERWEVAPVEAVIKLILCGLHFKRRMDGTAGLVVVGARVAEAAEDAVGDEFDDEPAVFAHDGDDEGEVVIDQPCGGVEAGAFAEWDVAGQVRDEDGGFDDGWRRFGGGVFLGEDLFDQFEGDVVIEFIDDVEASCGGAGASAERRRPH